MADLWSVEVAKRRLNLTPGISVVNLKTPLAIGD
jgi:hypothetical protein